MRFTGLKTTIAGTLVMLLGVALILGNIVTVVFWQKSLVQSEVEKTQAMISITEAFFEEKINSGRRVEIDDLERLIGDSEKSNRSILYYNGKEIIRYPPDNEGVVAEQNVRTSALSQKEILSFKGTRWALVSFGSNSLMVARPILTKLQKNAALGIQIELESVYQAIKSNLKVLLVYLLVNAMILSVIGLFRMFSLVVKPIERLVNVSESYQISDGLAFASTDVGSEFSQLSMALNSMLLRIEVDREQLKKTVNSLEEANKELIQTQKEMVVAEKLAAVGRLSAGLAHEIGNPLGIVQGYVELLQQSDVSSRDRHQFAERALSELERINRLIRQLLDFARATPKSFENFSLNHLLIELQEMFDAQYFQSKINLLIEIDDDCTIEGDRDGIKQVLLNCLLNSADSIELGDHNDVGNIKMTVSSRTDTENQILIVIRIEDSGHGIGTDQQDFLFEPFYSTKASGKGTGLGLFVSHAIIENHGGRMWLKGKEGKGAIVTIEVPQKQLHEV